MSDIRLTLARVDGTPFAAKSCGDYTTVPSYSQFAASSLEYRCAPVRLFRRIPHMPTWVLALSYWLHLIATIVWVGGMALAHFVY